jgi:hypothetical protein
LPPGNPLTHPACFSPATPSDLREPSQCDLHGDVVAELDQPEIDTPETGGRVHGVQQRDFTGTWRDLSSANLEPGDQARSACMQQHPAIFRLRCKFVDEELPERGRDRRTDSQLTPGNLEDGRHQAGGIKKNRHRTSVKVHVPGITHCGVQIFRKERHSHEPSVVCGETLCGGTGRTQSRITKRALGKAPPARVQCFAALRETRREPLARQRNKELHPVVWKLLEVTSCHLPNVEAARMPRIFAIRAV